MLPSLFPWGAMLRAALAAGIGPEAFWRLSLREWRWLAGGGGEAMDPGRLAALMGAYPDEVEREDFVPDKSSFDFAQDESALGERSC